MQIIFTSAEAAEPAIIFHAHGKSVPLLIESLATSYDGDSIDIQFDSVLVFVGAASTSSTSECGQFIATMRM